MCKGWMDGWGLVGRFLLAVFIVPVPPSDSYIGVFLLSNSCGAVLGVEGRERAWEVSRLVEALSRGGRTSLEPTPKWGVNAGGIEVLLEMYFYIFIFLVSLPCNHCPVLCFFPVSLEVRDEIEGC